MLRFSNAMLLILAFQICIGPAARAVTLVSGPLLADTTWRAAQGPFVVTATVTIREGRSLVIEPDTTVKFDAGASLDVQGRISASGAAGKRVVFTSSASNPSPGSWPGILLSGGGLQAPSSLSFAKIAFAGGQGKPALAIADSSPVLDHLTITGSAGDAVRISGLAAPQITNLALLADAGGLDASQAAPGVAARLTFWGAPSGPSGAGPGTGAPVSKGVSFDPWLLEAPSETDYIAKVTLSNETFDPAGGKTFALLAEAVLALCRVGFPVAHGAQVVIRDALGNPIRSFEAGSPAVISWNGRDESGILAPAGTYSYTLVGTAAEGDCSSTVPATGRVTLVSGGPLPTQASDPAPLLRR
jgi:hypothetical protein